MGNVAVRSVGFGHTKTIPLAFDQIDTYAIAYTAVN
jgi:hypothetical protein